ncbi:anthranilate synthase component I [Pullulanibacillus sp. KACC 23026]|uniref:anthranilate synthase component I n=1 Tax=Pullulanibacillus sp. KACC 23026 TaxID=3028315 RepID=UPI0023AEC61E|nr:anthranilate synthase component I [Pullulanibacillus sp. KACC 23026]WEG11370.1 anthranilate synthase component I [Pullulanibacillus sp. KACC 23026]
MTLLTPSEAIEKGFKTFPVSQTFFSDRLTPIDIAEKLGNELVFLLESREPSHSWSRHSFIGIQAFAKLFKEQESFIFTEDQSNVQLKADSLKELLAKVNKHLRPAPAPTSHGFPGGAVGAIAYDAVSDFDHIPPHQDNDLGTPPYAFVFCETIIAFDHYEQTMTFISFARHQEGECADDLQKKIDGLLEEQTRLANLFFQVNGTVELARPALIEKVADFNQAKSSMSKAAYVAAVEKIKDYIKAGDIFQAVLSNRYHIPLKVTPWQLYRALRIMNPSPYLFYMKLGEFELVGSSPERLVNIENQEVEIHPIAGTRKRGSCAEEDQALMEELLADEKERAEHMMLVDLARNDVGRVAEYGSVHVPVLMKAIPFAQVIHLVSKVRGTLKKDAEPIDALTSAFPAGTLSGAPKIRAMEIIAELEPVARGFYGGAVGYIGYDGTMDTCITIRTFVCHKGQAYVQAGAGIVADSIPENEWDETRNKARALFQALYLAERLFEKKEVENHV